MLKAMTHKRISFLMAPTRKGFHKREHMADVHERPPFPNPSVRHIKGKW